MSRARFLRRSDAAPLLLMKVEHKIVAAFTVAVVAVLLLGAMTYLNVRSLFERNVWVVHTYRVLGVISEFYDSISQVQSGGRGYLLTGKSEFLQPYQAGIDSGVAQIAELRRLTSDNPLQTHNLDQLQTLFNRAVAGLHDDIEVRQSRGPETVQNTFGLADKENMDQVRFTVAAMKNHENQLLEARSSQSTQSGRRTLANLGLLLVLALALLMGFFFFIRNDLAERQRADLALRESDKRFRGVLESAPDAMFIADQHGVIQTANPQAERIFGYPREEFTGTQLNSLLFRREVAKPATLEGATVDSSAATERAFQDFQSAAVQFDGVRKGGDLFPAEISRSTLEIADEHLSIVAVRDRTERQKAEDSLHKL